VGLLGRSNRVRTSNWDHRLKKNSRENPRITSNLSVLVQISLAAVGLLRLQNLSVVSPQSLCLCRLSTVTAARLRYHQIFCSVMNTDYQCQNARQLSGESYLDLFKKWKEIFRLRPWLTLLRCGGFRRQRAMPQDAPWFQAVQLGFGLVDHVKPSRAGRELEVLCLRWEQWHPLPRSRHRVRRWSPHSGPSARMQRSHKQSWLCQTVCKWSGAAAWLLAGRDQQVPQKWSCRSLHMLQWLVQQCSD